MTSVSPDPRFLPLIFDSIACGIFTIDSTGEITAFNRMAEELTGYTREEVIGRRCEQVFRGDHCEKSCPLKRSIRLVGRVEDNEVTVLTKTGEPLPLSIAATALTDDQGNVLGGVEMFRDLRIVTELRKQLTKSFVFADIVSKSPKMQRIFELLPLLANSQSTVLLQGESGTGKELVARAIHNLGPRRDRPFVALNCAAVPESLIESELFGYVKGAFTDARTDKPGRFALAEGGTLLLDEISEIPLQVQAKLLRVLQHREYEPLGSTATTSADVRIIAATNCDLEREVRQRRFRGDLYYRINVFLMELPPLRERKEDIPLLVQHFINRFNAIQGRQIAACSERVLSTLMRYSFPGNIRELENAIEHSFITCIASVIQVEDVPPHILARVEVEAHSLHAAALPLADAQAEVIRNELNRQGFNRTLTAMALGISRNTLWRKMRQYGIDVAKAKRRVVR